MQAEHNENLLHDMWEAWKSKNAAAVQRFTRQLTYAKIGPKKRRYNVLAAINPSGDQWATALAAP